MVVISMQKRLKLLFVFLFFLFTLKADTLQNNTFLLHFSNGDRLQVINLNLTGKRLRFSPVNASSSTISVLTSKIESITCITCREVPRKTNDHILTLRNGSRLIGTFIKLEQTKLKFQLPGSSIVSLPHSVIRSLSVLKMKTHKAPLKARDYTLITYQGDRLSGNLTILPGRKFLISKRGIEARISQKSVAVIFFPRENRSSIANITTKGSSRIYLQNGSIIFGKKIIIKKGLISLLLVGGKRIEIPLKIISQISLRGAGTRISSKKVLIWGRYADRDQELKRTIEILKTGLNKKWEIVSNFDDDFNETFQKELSESRTLLFPEMEQWHLLPNQWKGSDIKEKADRLKKILHSFLLSGGNIVILAPGADQTDFLKIVGLLDVKLTHNTNDSRILFTKEGQKFGQNIGPAFRTANATLFYQIGKKIKATIWAKNNRGAPIITRKVGKGSIILLGMDYFSKNKQTAKLLINAVIYK